MSDFAEPSRSARSRWRRPHDQALRVLRRPRLFVAVLLAVFAVASPSLRLTSSPSAPLEAVALSPSTPLSPFSGLVSAYVSGRAGSIEAALYDLHSGRTWELNPQLAPEATASIVKVDILETLLYRTRVARQTLSPSEQQLIQQMIEISSNSAATSLWYRAGGHRGIGAYNKLAGLTHTVMSNCGPCVGVPLPAWGFTTTTPEDQLLLLKQLSLPSHLLTTSQQQYAVGLMSNIAPWLKWGVSSDDPPGSFIAMKTGDVPISSDDEQVNSIGWVDGGGHDYLMTMLTTGDPSLQYGVDTLNEMSSLMWHQWNLDAGGGYWLTTAKGNVYNLGDTSFYGSERTRIIPAPVVAMTSTPDEEGYWLVTAKGNVYNFGDAAFYGSEASKVVPAAVVAMTPTPDGQGYWLVTAKGNVYNFGDASFYGSEATKVLPAPVVAVAPTPDGNGYWLVTSKGNVYNFGDADLYGSEATNVLPAPVVAVARG